MRLQLSVTHRVPSPPGKAAAPGWCSTEVEVDAPAGTTVVELVDALVEHLGPGAVSPPDTQVAAEEGPADRRAAVARPVLVAAGIPVDPRSLVGTPPLLDGVAVTLRSPKPLQDSHSGRAAARRSVVVLAITHGPDCGRSVDLHPGRHTIGRSEDADIRVDDARLSRLHAEVVVTSGGVTVRDLDSTNGTEVDAEPIGTMPVPITSSSRVRIGDTVVALVHPGAVPASTSATGDGTLAVNRRPRIEQPHRPATVTFPPEPTAPRRSRVPWVAALLPVPIAAALAFVVGPTMLAFALMGPALLLGTTLSDRWGARRTYAAELVMHNAAVARARDRVHTACREEERHLVGRHPDPAALLAIASGPTERLWERRRRDDDALHVSIGLCRREAAVRLAGTDPTTPGRPRLGHVPCTVPLDEVGVLGICGEPSSVAATARLVVGQLVTLHAPSEVEVVILLRDDEAEQRWAWTARTPHCRKADGSGRSAALTVLERDEPAARRTVTALADRVRHRLDAPDVGRHQGATTVLVVDGVTAFRGLPGMATLLRDGPRAGVLCVALERSRSGLPHEATAVLDLCADGAPVLDLPGHVHEDLVVDGAGPVWSSRLGRALAALRDAAPSSGPAPLPVSVGLEPAGLEDDGARLAEAWRERPHTTVVPLGVCGAGTFGIDLATDGPHLLLGGTTGSGKSELLRTLVASLALRNAPEHLSFVLVDYKGGAAFRDCAGLPHVAGVVTDLDDRLAARALTSLGAEIRRRERILRDAECADFVSYQRSPFGQRHPLARLVVVVDEFRALADELPAFVDGLVRLASLGRSLGIHLVLATQRPAGVVTADIKANVNLRIALRVRDRGDSLDVIDGPEAAAIDPCVPGRAFARAGGASLVEFQAAHVGSAFRDSGRQGVRIRPWSPTTPSPWPVRPDRRGVTELDRIVQTARRSAVLGRHAAARGAWLPPLPEQIAHDTLTAPTEPLTAHVGLVDVPDEQRQHPLAVSLAERGHWGVVGSPGSGRSSFLLTVASSLCARSGPAQLHLYAVGSGALAALHELPHLGASVDWSDLPRVERLLDRLSTEVARRRALPGAGTGATAGASSPRMLLLVDDWELVSGRSGDLALATVVDRVLALLREGESVGLVAVVAGDRSLLLGRAGGTLSHRIVLRLSDPTDAVLLGLPPRQVAALRRPGHGLTAQGREVQLALPPRPSSGDSRVLEPSFPGERPMRVEALPRVVREAQLEGPVPSSTREQGPTGNDAEVGDVVRLGVGGDEGRVLGLSPVRDGRRWLVAGGPGTGVSSTVLLVARSLIAAGRPVAVVAPRTGPLDALRGRSGVVARSDGTDVSALVEARRRAPSLAVVVDAADELLDQPIEPVLREITALVDRDAGLVVVGAGVGALASLYRGLVVEVARHRTGILLGPRSAAEAQAFGVRVAIEREARPGRGHVVRRGAATPIQVALPTVVSAPPASHSPGARPAGSVTA